MRISDWSSDVCSSDLDGGKKLEDEQPDKEQERTLHEVREDNGVDDVPMIAQEARPAGDVVHGECRQQHRGAPAARNAQREEADHGAAFRAGIGRLRRRNSLRIALAEAFRIAAGPLGLVVGNRSEVPTYELQSLMRTSYAVI